MHLSVHVDDYVYVDSERDFVWLSVLECHITDIPTLFRITLNRFDISAIYSLTFITSPLSPSSLLILSCCSCSLSSGAHIAWKSAFITSVAKNTIWNQVVSLRNASTSWSIYISSSQTCDDDVSLTNTCHISSTVPCCSIFRSDLLCHAVWLLLVKYFRIRNTIFRLNRFKRLTE